MSARRKKVISTEEIQFNHKPTKMLLTEKKKGVSENGQTPSIIGICSYCVLSLGDGTLSQNEWCHPLVIGWSKYKLGLPQLHRIVGSCDLCEIWWFFRNHWQSSCTALTAGKCLPLGLCKGTVKESSDFYTTCDCPISLKLKCHQGDGVFHYWLHRNLAFRQLPLQPSTNISPTSWPFYFNISTAVKISIQIRAFRHLQNIIYPFLQTTTMQ